MKKRLIILIMSLAVIFAAASSSYAHEAEGKKHHPVKSAIRELHEAKEILGKIPADAAGHVANASHAVDQALQELSAVKAEPQKS